jgi:hypothetical protein
MGQCSESLLTLLAGAYSILSHEDTMPFRLMSRCVRCVAWRVFYIVLLHKDEPCTVDIVWWLPMYNVSVNLCDSALNAMRYSPRQM